ncbi:MAG TPA: hypothetical protein VL201_04885 [Patescibacteria group bacterium]|nr:hypothetical protein [Patescibacteria group bacterium]
MNRKKIAFYKIAFYLCILFIFCDNLAHSFVQYTLSQGRFGDQLLAYAKAQYIANLYHIPLLYTPFKHAELIELHYAQLPYAEYYKNSFLQEIVINRESCINRSDKNFLYTVNLSTKHKDITNLDSIALYVLQNKKYGQKIKKMLTPHVPLHIIDWPKDCITVALHVRKPSGYDTSLTSKQFYDINVYKNLQPTLIEKKGTMPSDKRYPHKFPPDQYYIDQIHLLATLFPEKKLYVYLFTDYHDPQELVELYKPHIHGDHITLTCHAKEQQQYTRFIDDYYNMSQTDCLIRASSNFSRAAQLIGDHKIVIYPKSTHWYGDAVIVEEVWILSVDHITKQYTIRPHGIF